MLLENITEEIRRFKQVSGHLPASDEFVAAVARLRAGWPDPTRDSWGRALRYARVGDGVSARYILVAVGRDGRLDVARLEDYLHASPANVNGAHDRDLVVVDGEFVRIAGK